MVIGAVCCALCLLVCACVCFTTLRAALCSSCSACSRFAGACAVACHVGILGAGRPRAHHPGRRHQVRNARRDPRTLKATRLVCGEHWFWERRRLAAEAQSVRACVRACVPACVLFRGHPLARSLHHHGVYPHEEHAYTRIMWLAFDFRELVVDLHVTCVRVCRFWDVQCLCFTMFPLPACLPACLRAATRRSSRSSAVSCLMRMQTVAFRTAR